MILFFIFFVFVTCTRVKDDYLDCIKLADLNSDDMITQKELILFFHMKNFTNLTMTQVFNECDIDFDYILTMNDFHATNSCLNNQTNLNMLNCF